MKTHPPIHVLTLVCPDRIGIVHAVAKMLLDHACNIVESAQFTDPRSAEFFMRVAFAPPVGFDCDGLRSDLAVAGASLGMSWQVQDTSDKLRILVMVSRFGHCLNDLLFRHASGTLPVEILAVVSNHHDFEQLASNYGIPFHHLPITAESKARQEARLLEIVDAERIDLVVLARYMQVLSNELCQALGGKAINIHHSFLPSFKGAKPYHQAYDRGVKLIGATAHYVTSDLDEGPIIEQDVARAEHSLSPEDLVAAGRDIESVVLARAVRLHAERRVMLSGHRTVIFK